MNILKYNNENIFLERKNKIILTDYMEFYYFMKSLKKMDNIELNGLKLNSKNTLFIDISSISGLIDLLSNNNQIVDSYIKVKLEKLIFDKEDDDILKNIINKYLNNMFGCYWNYDVELDYSKLMRIYTDISIDNENIFFEMLNCILDSEIFKEIIIIYKRSIINKFRLQMFEEINNENIILMEICDKESNIQFQDNILIFDKEITQIRVDDFLDLVMKNCKFKKMGRENCMFLLNKILFLAINKKEVDIMKKYTNEILEIIRILKEEFKLNLNDTTDYI